MTADTHSLLELYRKVFDLSSEVIIITSMQGDIITCNNTAIRTFGFETLEEIYQKKVFDFYSDPDILSEVIDQLTRTGIYTYDNISLKKKDETILYCSGTAVLHNGPDNTTCIINTLYDITRNLEIVSALAESEERYKEIVENINDIIYTLDDQGFITYISPVVEQLSGFKVSELIGHHFLELIHPDDVPELLQSYERTLTGKIEPFFFRIRDKDGSTHYVRSSSRIIETDGKATGIRAILTDMSEKWESDEKLRFQAMLLDQIQDRITATDLDGRITYINNAELSLLKRTREEIIGNNIFLFGDDPEIGATQKQILETTLSEGSWSGTVVNYASGGEKKILESRTWLIKDPKGAPTGMVGVSTDVTTHMKTAEALKATLEQNRAILHTLQDIIYIFDQEGLCINILSVQEERYRYNAELMLGKSLKDILSSEQADFFISTINQAIETGETRVVQYEMEEPSGTRYYEGRVAPLKYGTEEKQHVAWFAADSTEKKLAKEALVLSEQRYRKLIETINIAIFVTRNGKILYINSYSSILIGFSEDELINRPFLDFVHPNDRDIIIERHRRRMNNETVSNRFPFRIINKAGNILWMEISAILTEWDNLPSVLNIMIDITERIMAEEQMRMAKERAEEADRLKSAFLANISHELRTPINAINGSIDLLLDDDSGENRTEYLKIIQHSSSLLLSLIEDTLDLSKIESGQVEISNNPFNLAEVLRQVDLNARLMITRSQKEISFTSHIDDGISRYVIGDQIRLQQVLNNLLNNAVKFTDSGTVELGVSLTEDNMLGFTITDTGVGIPPGMRIRIFDRFQQVDQSYRRKYSGVGLGLTISKSLVELMQGTIFFKSISGSDHGSTFTVTIPYNPSAEPAESVSRAREKHAGKDIYTILIVEDNRLNLLLTSRILEKEGYLVITAVNGREAVSLYTSGAPVDLVLMDIQMPLMDGLEATAAIRDFEQADGGTAHIPIVVLSAHAATGDRERVFNAGCDDYITKPIERGSLLKKLSEYLSPWDNQGQS